MPLTPSQAVEHIKESVVEYLETAYKIAHPLVYAERGQILREQGTVAQAPFIEATPAFPGARKLIELERAYSKFLPEGLAELVQHGVPVDRFHLYTHQEEALLAAFSDKPNLLVTTGTGSGKTEAFLLPILADILREAQRWPAASAAYQRGEYDKASGAWLHSRRHEQRPAALRAIILYPMNALVNDQLSRLRRILARGASPDWQRANLNGNLIHFGMYTGLSAPTGQWSDKAKRDRYAAYAKSVEDDWAKLRPDLREKGFWPRPDGPEMLCRWDMQLAPPDVMVTNYSMLEYMMVRALEAPIFDRTAKWLQSDPEARLTLVLDEAHTYTGAKGTEVAHLVRRLKERLGISSGSNKFRAIATSASIPPGADKQILQFTSDLFGEPQQRFSLIRLKLPPRRTADRVPTEPAMKAFAKFQQTFDLQTPMSAIKQLAADLKLGRVDETVDPQVALHTALKDNADALWVRERTARNATLLDQLATECWGIMGTSEERERATAGIVAAGSYARASELQDTPPLLSMRMHIFYRGVAGIWACMDTECPEVAPAFRQQEGRRPVGKLYLEPRPWCTCGARVLELFSCRHCGLLFLGGIPDNGAGNIPGDSAGSLWPWSDDLSGERQDLKLYQVFGVEQPHPEVIAGHRSTRSTLPAHPNEPYVRDVFEIEPAEENDNVVSPFPMRCPRCQNYRVFGPDGREVIEPLRTRGPRTFSVIVEDGFRVQPRAAGGEPPNYGRKALLFTDSRNEAAQLAAELRRDHHNDLFRQLAYRALYSCRQCNGKGTMQSAGAYVIGEEPQMIERSCEACAGSGRATNAEPLKFRDLRDRVIDVQLGLGIDPTNDTIQKFYAKQKAGDPENMAKAEMGFDLAMRRDIAEDEFALEPLGLAAWRIPFPQDAQGALESLTQEETRVFLRCVTRILATENILLPSEPFKPWEWPHGLVKQYERQRLFYGFARSGDGVPYNLSDRRKIGRYVIAVSQALVRAGRLPNDGAAKEWIKKLVFPLLSTLRGLNILRGAGARINDQATYGIRIDSFELHPVGENVERCEACAYVMSEALFGVCLRCGQSTSPVPVSDLNSFYRRSALYALPESEFDDPYPLRAIEHTAQIEGVQARDIERWFQDVFHNDQDPRDHRVDVLSVTTTMEMGIDIGSLLSVGLRNVPPNVANYQQRAGRAGRRGSALATVLTFAQFRSHDQYYFDRPPEIVSAPPRVPSLYLQNAVIAQRHVRSLVLQGFFYAQRGGAQANGLFGAWGTVGDFNNNQWADKLIKYLGQNRAPLIDRCTKVVHAELVPMLGGWIDALPQEVQVVITRQETKAETLVALINAGLLPKYAFPVDVVSLAIPSFDNPYYDDEGNWGDSNGMQRDLKIALSEYAPGAETVRGEFPKTYVYRSAALYDAYERNPNYGPSGIFFECNDCQSIDVLDPQTAAPDQCPECGSFNVQALPYIRPPGFTVDVALPNAGRVEYEGGGRERAGTTLPARLMLGESSFHVGKPQKPFAPALYAHLRQGDLFLINKGPDRRFPGFLICPVCGRALEEPGKHKYPNNVPPNVPGPNRGPRAGQWCPNQTVSNNQLTLGYPFHSEVMLLGVDLPATMDAPFDQASGRAVWYSFGTLIANAATVVLQIDPGELKVGARAALREKGRLHAEVFLYDDVPGGAGYARAIGANLQEILEKALALGEQCANPGCAGACYRCMYDYRNQFLHPILDRALGADMLRFVLKGTLPSLGAEEAERGARALDQFVRSGWTVTPGIMVGSVSFARVLQNVAQKAGLWVIHPLAARPSEATRQQIFAQTKIRPAVHTLFDLERRPFWVMNNLIR
jgi:ATP-dependent helicase YprA (DUF1998 family)